MKTENSENPDLIIVGAGSAGCVLAAKLSRLGTKVLLIEAPSDEARRKERQQPARWLSLLGSAEDWDFATEACGPLSGRQLRWPRGRGLGGSSRINSMIWFPPTPADYRMLILATGGAWRREDLQAAYDEVVRDVKPEAPRWLSDPSQQFMRAVESYPDSTPMIYQRTNRTGQRWHAGKLLKKEGSVVRGTVDRILFSAKRATGVILNQDNRTLKLQSNHGVVLCSGTIGSPSVLMRSGIGDRKQLVPLSISVRADVPAVGQHLQDHLVMPLILRTRPELPSFLNQWSDESSDVQWEADGSGPMTSNIAECGGLFSGETMQIHVTPTHYLTFPKPQSDNRVMTLAVNLTQPESEGCLALRSREASESPIIDPGYFQNSRDLENTVEAVQLARRIGQSTSLSESISGELVPGAKRTTPDSIAKSVARYSQPLYHPVGTCRMGDQSDCVVDSNLQVQSTDRLWVVDGSILPRLTVGNPTATIMMLASHAAGLIQSQLT